MNIFQKLPTLNEIKGSFGEHLAKFYLKAISDGYILHDVLIDGAENATSQIDLIIIGTKGIYVTEVKNYAENACIYGDADKKNWYYYLGGKKYNIYSPIKQNEQHIRYLKKQLDLSDDIPFFSVVLMLCKDFKVTNINPEGQPPQRTLCNSMPAMEQGILKIAEAHKEVLTKEQGKEIFDKINALRYTEKSAKQEHKEKVKDLQKEIQKTDAEHICPYCKTPLVLRNGKFGKFYGCSNYPKCKFTQKV